MEYHVLIKQGDARAEVDALLRELGLTGDAAGMHKYIFAAQANQTVVMTTDRTAPLAAALRGRRGWQEPGTARAN